MNEQQLAAVKQALEALRGLASDTGKFENEVPALTALQSIISQDALDKKAAQPAVPLTDLGTLQAIVDEYYAWIRHHAAGHDYDDFLRNRGITAAPKKGQQ